MAQKITIGEVRARRTDPTWRRRYKTADITGLVLVVALLVVPPVCVLLSRPLGAAVLGAILLVAPAALASSGPTVGLERRTALLVAVPVLNLVILVPAVWRSAHLHLQHWQGPLGPDWDDGLWLAATVAGVVCWLAAAASLALLVT
jgi:hypothetical protein